MGLGLIHGDTTTNDSRIQGMLKSPRGMVLLKYKGEASALINQIIYKIKLRMLRPYHNDLNVIYSATDRVSFTGSLSRIDRRAAGSPCISPMMLTGL